MSVRADRVTRNEKMVLVDQVAIRGSVISVEGLDTGQGINNALLKTKCLDGARRRDILR